MPLKIGPWAKRRLKRLDVGLSPTDKRLKKIERTLAQIQETIGGMGIRGQLRHMDLEIKALLRAQYLNGSPLLEPSQAINAQRFHYWSQNEEDGLTLAFFKHIGVAVRRFIEIGCGSNGGNSGFLAAELGWSGLMVDGDEHKVSMCRDAFASDDVKVIHAWIAVDTVNQLVADQGLAGEADFLSIDLDGNDYWIWNALSVCSPRLVVVEYNSAFGPERSVTIPYAPDFGRKNLSDGRLYFGASLPALEKLAAQKGYRLVAVEPRGTNAFFLRRDVAPEIPARRARELYRPLAKYFQRIESSDELFTELNRRNLELVEV